MVRHHQLQFVYHRSKCDFNVYDFNVIYRPGKTNIADSLSRLNSLSYKFDPCNDNYDCVRTIVSYSAPKALTPKEIEQESAKDLDFANIRHKIHKIE